MCPATGQSANLVRLHDRGCWQWDVETLEHLVVELAEAAQTNERGFLELCGQVSHFHARAQGISRAASEVLELLHGDDGENTLQQLQLLVERCGLWLTTTSEKSIEISSLLRDVLRRTADLEQPLSGLRKVIKTLHSLRVSTRIEAAKGYATGAAVLAKSLDELGSLVHEKVAGIVARSETLEQMISRSLEGEVSAQSGSIVVAGQKVQQARHLLSSFMTNCIESAQWTDRLKERSERVAHNFGEMVASLQFQDITRQRIGHVEQALTNLGQHLRRICEHSAERRDANVSRLVGRICRLQHEQLSLASRDFNTAADNLSENLCGMTVSAKAVAADTRALARATDLNHGNRYHLVLDILKTIADCLLEARAAHLAAGSHLADVCRGIGEVSVLVEDVELISEEMQLLAMNAAISAAHARQKGAGLDIIAQNIHVVAEEATALAVALARECAGITQQAGQLQDIERDTESSSRDVADLLDVAKHRTSTIEEGAARLSQRAAKVEQSAAELADDVGKAIRISDIKEDLQRKLVPAFERLALLGASADMNLPGADGSSLDALFRDLERCYTMDSERRIHHRYVDGHASPPRADIEGDDWAAKRHHGLGDNVDLF